MTPPKPSTTEQGSMLPANGLTLPIGRSASRGFDLDDTDEYVPDLVWPACLDIFEQMVRSDPQVSALMESVTLPIMRRRYELDPSGADDIDVKRIAEDLGVPVLGSSDPDPIRGRARFNFREHLEQALLGLRYGSYWFEQVGEIVDGAWRLRKLAPRPTRTLEAVRVDRSGSLVGITQAAHDARSGPVLLDVGRIVGYVWKREGANWYGTSMLRSVYGSWYFKRDALRADTVQKRRNSLGVPVFNPGSDPSPDVLAAYAAMGRKLSAGQEVSIVLHAADASFTLQGVTGTLPNALESARYHDEQLATAFLAMWMKLGQTATGSRALGDTLLDVFNAALDAIADDWFCATLNEHVIRDWMLFNYGEGHNRVMPRLVSRRVESPELAISDLAVAVEKGVITADPSLKAWVRSNYNIPAADEAESTTEPKPTEQVQAQRHEHVVHAGALDDGPTSRQRWRELTDREVRAAIDPESMDQRWRDATAAIVAAWPSIQAAQVDALIEQIIEANGDLPTLARLWAPVEGRQIIAKHMGDIAKAAAEDVIREAAAQGVTVGGVVLERTDALIVGRSEATAAMLAQSLQMSASHNAIRLTGAGSTPQQVADGVRVALGELSDTRIADQAQGALTSAQNAARAEATDAAPEPPARIVATEIMDANTCGPCSDIDGKEYASMAEAEADYPDSGYMNCDGFDRCRGFLFSEWDTN